MVSIKHTFKKENWNESYRLWNFLKILQNIALTMLITLRVIIGDIVGSRTSFAGPFQMSVVGSSFGKSVVKLLRLPDANLLGLFYYFK